MLDSILTEASANNPQRQTRATPLRPRPIHLPGPRRCYELLVCLVLAIYQTFCANATSLASPHDAHLLATFSQDSNVIRVLDVRQPGQALLELKGHSGPINCVEWCPARRGTLASGADDSLVLIWDLINQNNAASITPQASTGQPHHGASSGSSAVDRGPAASWQCDYEVSNISWAPHTPGNNNTSGWLGVSGGKGLWGVSI